MLGVLVIAGVDEIKTGTLDVGLVVRVFSDKVASATELASARDVAGTMYDVTTATLLLVIASMLGLAALGMEGMDVTTDMSSVGLVVRVKLG